MILSFAIFVVTVIELMVSLPVKTLFSSQVAELRSTKEQLKAKQDELVAERDSSRKEKEARAEEVICALLMN